MVWLRRLATKSGDAGETGLGDGSRVPKTDPRIEALGAIHEANAAIGVAVAAWKTMAAAGDGPPTAHPSGVPTPVDVIAFLCQRGLFEVGTDLCVPLGDPDRPDTFRMDDDRLGMVDMLLGGVLEEVKPAASFVIPGGGEAAAHLHLASTVVRRAELAVWRAGEVCGMDSPGGINSAVARYLNRLSDLLFALARVSTPPGDEVLWEAEGDTV